MLLLLIIFDDATILMNLYTNIISIASNCLFWPLCIFNGKKSMCVCNIFLMKKKNYVRSMKFFRIVFSTRFVRVFRFHFILLNRISDWHSIILTLNYRIFERRLHRISCQQLTEQIFNNCVPICYCYKWYPLFGSINQQTKKCHFANVSQTRVGKICRGMHTSNKVTLVCLAVSHYDHLVIAAFAL